MSRLLKIVSAVSFSLVLGACSTSNESKRQITDSEGYLDSSELKPLIVPAGATLPRPYEDFAIPAGSFKGNVGKLIDIRPPIQALPLLSGSRTAVYENQSEIRFEGMDLNLRTLINGALRSAEYTIKKEHVDKETGHLQWTIDWVTWKRLDEKDTYQATYQIDALGNNYSNVVSVKLVELRNNDGAISDPVESSRYSVMMLNSLVEHMVVELNKKSMEAAENQAGSFVVQKAVDETGLPLMVVRAPYAVVWQSLPGVLSKANMTISESNRANGLISMKYKSLSSEQLSAFGVSELELDSDEYTLQVGDLGNRTTLQFRSKKGQPVDSKLNDTLVEIMQSAFNQPDKVE